MDPRQLIQLATILECGSLSKASQILHLTQPTLTHSMQTLETRAGGKLFERSRFGDIPDRDSHRETDVVSADDVLFGVDLIG